MDIHRCRFLAYPPESINALAFSHLSDTTATTPQSCRLALGRSNGDIEIWNPNDGYWFQETILRGGKGRSIEGLAWTQEPAEEGSNGSANEEGQLRLFSIGDSPSVTEWDIATGAPLRHVDGNSGDIWCLAAQPRRSDPGRVDQKPEETESSSLLAAGCGNGAIVLFTTEDGDLRYLRSLGRPPIKKPKVLSITWRDSDTIVAGYDDSAIRVYDVQKRHTLRTMSLGAPAEGNESYVWCVRCLKDGTILSGDSSGELKIWDSQNYSLVQRLKTHDADILDIGTSSSGDKIFTVGVDRRTVAYKPVMNQTGPRKQRWTELMHRRLHQHDVKAVATFESKDLSIIVSGGVDTIPIIAPMRRWQDEYHRSLSNLPQRSQSSSSRQSRLVLTWWARELTVWRLQKIPTDEEEVTLPIRDAPHYDRIANLGLSSDESITSAHISESGKFIVVSTVASVKLFQLRWSSKNGVATIRSRQISLPPSMSNFGARVVKFSPDCRWICAVRLSNVIAITKIVDLASSTERPDVVDNVVRLKRKPRSKAGGTRRNGLGAYIQSITHLEFSENSRYLACGDISGSIDVWCLEGSEDLEQIPAVVNGKHDESSSDDSDSDSDDGDDDIMVHGQKWVRNPAGSSLPQLDSPILTLTFRPSGKDTKPVGAVGSIGLHATRHNPHPVSHEMPYMNAKLIAITGAHHITEFDVAECKLSDWTRRNPQSCLPCEFTRIKDRVMGCFWDTHNDWTRLWLYGSTWLFMFDMSQDLPVSQSLGRLGHYDVLEPVANQQKKRKYELEPIKGKIKRSTGAGDEIAERDRYLGVGPNVPKFRDASAGNNRVVSFDRLAELPNDYEDIDAQSNASLALMRRGTGPGSAVDLPEEVSSQPDNATSGSKGNGTTRKNKQPGWWHTFNYRSIFGIVPIKAKESRRGADAGDDKESRSRIEVAIIERPIYDLDFPPRFDSGQDWDA